VSTAENAQAVVRLLTELGLSIEDLRHAREPTPTLALYLPRVIEASGPGALRTYAPYWALAIAAYGDRRLDQITTTELEALIRQAVRQRVRRRNDRGGTSTREHMLRALRAIYSRAVADNILPAHRNPAVRALKPPRPQTTRRALSVPGVAGLPNPCRDGSREGSRCDGWSEALPA
jgi:hypothetical protein